MDLVAPIIPDAQKNLAASLFLEGAGRGLAAAAQFAQIRRQSESDIARLALAERNAEREHNLNAQRMSQEYELRDRQMTQTEEMLPYLKEASAAQADLSTQHARAWADGTATAAQMKAETVRQKNLLLKEVADSARTMKLDDPHFQTKNPMEFAKNVLEFGRMYHLSPLPEVRRAIKEYQAVADSQKLFIKHGEEDEETGSIKGKGNGRQVPAWRIIANINNPDTRDQTLRDLEASGYTELAKGFQQMTDKGGKKVQVPTTTRTLRQPVRRMLEESQALTMPDATTPDVPESDVSAVERPMPDYGPEPTAPKYPVGARGRRGDKWFVMTEDGWQQE